MTQLSLFNINTLYGTIAYSAPVEVSNEKDRANRQVDAVRNIMTLGGWYTFDDLRDSLLVIYGIHASEAGISARIRDLRKPEFGSHTIERRVRSGNLYEYRMVK